MPNSFALLVTAANGPDRISTALLGFDISLQYLSLHLGTLRCLH